MIRLLVISLLLTGNLHAQTKTEEKVVALQGATIHTAKGAPIPIGTLLIKGGKILDLGKDVVPPKGAEILDLSGKVIYPGFIDPASYLFLPPTSAITSGSPESTVLDEIDPFQEDYREAVAAGITAVCVLPRASGMMRGISSVLKLTSDRKKRVLRKGSALHCSLSSGSSNSSDSFSRFAKVEALRAQFKAAKAYKDSWEKYQKDLAEYEKKKKEADQAAKAKKESKTKKAETLKKPKKPGVNLRYQVLAQTLISKNPLPVRVEAHFTDSIEWVLALAKEYKFTLILDQVSAGDSVIQSLQEAKVSAIVGPVFRYGLRKVDYSTHSAGTAFRLKKGGVLVALGSFPYGNAGHQGIGATRFLPEAVAWASRGIGSSEEALKMITSDAATLLGVGKRIGTLEKGKDADLVVITGGLLSSDRIVERTMINGRWEFVRKER
jgi:imidazolonepropionase-like amidohydrolase